MYTLSMVPNVGEVLTSDYKIFLLGKVAHINRLYTFDIFLP